jgi:hypothetical protein
MDLILDLTRQVRDSRAQRVYTPRLPATHMLILKPTDLGSGKVPDDFEVLDAARKPVGRIMWAHAASRETPWFWTITARFPNSMHDRGYAATREDARADFKAAWERKP